MKKVINWIIYLLIFPIFLIIYCIIVLIKIIKKNKKRNKNPRLIWGPIPIINNKYWSNALKKKNFISITLMNNYFNSINNRLDFNQYIDELFIFKYFTGFLNKIFIHTVIPFYSFIYSIWKYDIFHHPFSGGYLGNTPFWKLETKLLHLCGCKVIIIGYGGDFYCFSKINNISWRHALLLSYPDLAKEEIKNQKRINYWIKNADIILNGFQIEGLGRWDALAYSILSIDTKKWSKKLKYSRNNGLNGVVNIIHTPNRRGVKGTEFIIEAVDSLKNEGLKINLILIENKKNDEVKNIISEVADLLIDQLILGYGLSAVEGMAVGIPVLSNLSNEYYTRVFRRYSYLNECPILSTTPENIKENLRILITKPELREILGRASRKYVEKYHSEETAQFLFSSIYDKIWFGADIDLMNLFHPLKSKYNKSKPFVKHPLFENKLPEDYLSNC